mgnify:CR=1 FL=1
MNWNSVVGIFNYFNLFYYNLVTNVQTLSHRFLTIVLRILSITQVSWLKQRHRQLFLEQARRKVPRKLQKSLSDAQLWATTVQSMHHGVILTSQVHQYVSKYAKTISWKWIWRYFYLAKIINWIVNDKVWKTFC